MNLLRRIVVAFAGIGVVTLLVGLAAPKAMHAVAPTPVTVVNTPGVKVLNAPSVNISNTVPVKGTVAVSSLPAVQLSGSTNVSNPTSGGNPVPLMTLAAEAVNSFSATGSCKWSNNSQCQILSLLTVPAGKTAVVEAATGICQLDPSTSITYYQLQDEAAGGTGTFWLGSPAGVVAFSGVSGTAFGQNMKLYIHGGSGGHTLFMSAFASAAELNPGFCTATLSGYYLPVP